MAEHYRNGGLPPWAVVGDGVKAPLVQNDFNSYDPRTSYTGAPFKANAAQNDYNAYPPTPSQPQYDPSHRYTGFTPYEAPPQSYKGY